MSSLFWQLEEVLSLILRKGLRLVSLMKGMCGIYMTKKIQPNHKKALPVATILTIPAAGSETSASTVLSNMETGRKYGCSSELVRPVLSILSPDLCLTLPKNQAANGICDMMAHIMERYFSHLPM